MEGKLFNIKEREVEKYQNFGAIRHKSLLRPIYPKKCCFFGPLKLNISGTVNANLTNDPSLNFFFEALSDELVFRVF